MPLIVWLVPLTLILSPLLTPLKMTVPPSEIVSVRVLLLKEEAA